MVPGKENEGKGNTVATDFEIIRRLKREAETNIAAFVATELSQLQQRTGLACQGVSVNMERAYEFGEDPNTASAFVSGCEIHMEFLS